MPAANGTRSASDCPSMRRQATFAQPHLDLRPPRQLGDGRSARPARIHRPCAIGAVCGPSQPTQQRAMMNNVVDQQAVLPLVSIAFTAWTSACLVSQKALGDLRGGACNSAVAAAKEVTGWAVALWPWLRGRGYSHYAQRQPDRTAWRTASWKACGCPGHRPGGGERGVSRAGTAAERVFLPACRRAGLAGWGGAVCLCRQLVRVGSTSGGRAVRLFRWWCVWDTGWVWWW